MYNINNTVKGILTMHRCAESNLLPCMCMESQIYYHAIILSSVFCMSIESQTYYQACVCMSQIYYHACVWRVRSITMHVYGESDLLPCMCMYESDLLRYMCIESQIYYYACVCMSQIYYHDFIESQIYYQACVCMSQIYYHACVWRVGSITKHAYV